MCFTWCQGALGRPSEVGGFERHLTPCCRDGRRRYLGSLGELGLQIWPVSRRPVAGLVRPRWVASTSSWPVFSGPVVTPQTGRTRQILHISRNQRTKRQDLRPRSYAWDNFLETRNPFPLVFVPRGAPVISESVLGPSRVKAWTAQGPAGMVSVAKSGTHKSARSGTRGTSGAPLSVAGCSRPGRKAEVPRATCGGALVLLPRSRVPDPGVDSSGRSGAAT